MLGELTRKSRAIWMLLLVFSSLCFGQQIDKQYQDLGKKTFTLEQQYQYFHQKYKNVIIEHFIDEQIEASDGPDRALVRFLSAILYDNFNWWQSIWSQQTRDDWAAKESINKAQRSFNAWKARFNKDAKAELTDFVVMRERVLIGLKITTDSANFYLMPFVLEDGVWRVDESFMNTVLFQQLSLKISASK